MELRPTVRQLATIAGVSRTTVSMALRNHPRISTETRQRILALAEEKGYTPDPLVSTLMNQLRTARHGRSVERLAYLTWWQEPESWMKNTNDLNFYEGALDRAAQFGYEIEHIWAKEPRMTAARLSKILYTRALRGVIIAPLTRPRGHISLDWRHFACAAISYTVVRPELHRVSHGHYNGAILAMRRLKQHGYKRVGLANLASHIERVNHGWLAGYMIYEQGLPVKQRIPPLLQKEWNTKQFAAWLEKYKPDAVVSNTREPLQFMRHLGYRVPEDIGYASLDKLTPDDPWAGVDQQARMVGATAVDIVTAQVQRNEFGLPSCAKAMLIDGIWRDGPTILHKGH